MSTSALTKRKMRTVARGWLNQHAEGFRFITVTTGSNTGTWELREGEEGEAIAGALNILVAAGGGRVTLGEMPGAEGLSIELRGNEPSDIEPPRLVDPAVQMVGESVKWVQGIGVEMRGMLRVAFETTTALAQANSRMATSLAEAKVALAEHTAPTAEDVKLMGIERAVDAVESSVKAVVADRGKDVKLFLRSLRQEQVVGIMGLLDETQKSALRELIVGMK